MKKTHKNYYQIAANFKFHWSKKKEIDFNERMPEKWKIGLKQFIRLL